MLCQLSYEGLEDRLRTLPAKFRAELGQRGVRCLLNALRLPADPATERPMPDNRRSCVGEIAAAAHGHSALPCNGHKTLGHDACRHAFAEEFRQPSRGSQFDELPAAVVADPAEPLGLGVPTAVLNLVPADVLPARLAAVRQ